MFGLTADSHHLEHCYDMIITFFYKLGHQLNPFRASGIEIQPHHTWALFPSPTQVGFGSMSCSYKNIVQRLSNLKNTNSPFFLTRVCIPFFFWFPCSCGFYVSKKSWRWTGSILSKFWRWFCGVAVIWRTRKLWMNNLTAMKVIWRVVMSILGAKAESFPERWRIGSTFTAIWHVNNEDVGKRLVFIFLGPLRLKKKNENSKCYLNISFQVESIIGSFGCMSIAATIQSHSFYYEKTTWHFSRKKSVSN